MLLRLILTWSFLERHLGIAQLWTSTHSQCPQDSFYNSANDQCVRCRRCDHFSTVRRPCEPTRDAECVTCTGDNALQRPECRNCPPCPAGQYQFRPCTKHSLTVCRTCDKGSFNPKLSYSNRCTPCKSCYVLDRTVVAQCTASTDAVCGGCRKGYYLERGPSSRCVPCRPCVEGGGQKRIEKCRLDGVGRECEKMVIDIRDLDSNFTLELMVAVGQSFHESTTLQTVDESTTTLEGNETDSGQGQRNVHTDTVVVWAIAISLPSLVLIILCVTLLIKVRNNLKHSDIMVGKDYPTKGSERSKKLSLSGHVVDGKTWDRKAPDLDPSCAALTSYLEKGTCTSSYPTHV